MNTPTRLRTPTLDQRANDLKDRLLGELVQARHMTGWSQDQLARTVSVDPEIITKLETGSGSVTTLIAVMAGVNFQLAGIARGNTLGEQLANRRAKLKLSLEMAAAKTQLPEVIIAGLEKDSGAVTLREIH